MSAKEFHLKITPYNASELPSRLLAADSQLSRQQVKQAMHKGAVWLTHAKHTRRLRRDQAQLKPGDKLHLYFNPEVLQQEPLEPKLIADEEEYSVWCKPAGMLSQGSKWSDHTTLTRWAELHIQPQRPAFLVHRLDRFADGLMLIAHTKSMARQLSGKFENREVEKLYNVWVHGEFPGQGEAVHIDKPLDGKSAISLAQRIGFDADSNQSLLEVRIETGRKHQVRRHLAGVGFPVVGDKLHGENETGDLRLSAVLIAFEHPQSGERKRYELKEKADSSNDH